MLLTATSLTLLLAAAPLPDTLPGSVRGSVQSDPSGLPLPAAVVELSARGVTRTATTDSAGRYRLARVPAGRGTLRVRQIDHVPLELDVLVPPGGQVLLDIALRPQPVPLDPVVAQANAGGMAGDTARAGGGDLATVGNRAVEGGADAVAASVGLGSTAPPGSEPGGIGDALYVRGAASDLKLVLLDGAPVYTPFHLGGLMRSFEPDVLGSARLYLGGAPAQFDGGLAYIMDLRTRAGRSERARYVASADLVSGRLSAEGPLAGGATYLAAARAVNGAPIERATAEAFPYEYAEGLMRVDVPAGRRGIVSLTGFINREGTRVDSLARDPFARWGSAAVSLRFRGRLGGEILEVTSAASSFAARVPWNAGREILLSGGTKRLRTGIDLTHPLRYGRLRYGVGFDRTQQQAVSRSSASKVPLTQSGSTAEVFSSYADLSAQPAARLLVRGGARVDYFPRSAVTALAPRLSATWLLGERAALTLATGRYHQYVQMPLRGGGGGTSLISGDSARAPLGGGVARATHFSLALDQALTREVQLGVEGYFKEFRQITAGDERSFASGFDLWTRRAAGTYDGWLGYSLAWAWTPDDAQAPARFQGRQVLTAGVAGPVIGRGRFDVRLAYGAGLPYSVVIADDPAPASQIAREIAAEAPTTPASLAPRAGAAYLRLDAEVSRTWNPNWWGRRREVTPYLRVLNALDRRDALFYRGSGTATPRPIETLPLLPVFGLTLRT